MMTEPSVIGAVLFAIYLLTCCKGCWIGFKKLRRRGSNGSRFYGCTRYPKCDWTTSAGPRKRR